MLGLYLVLTVNCTLMKEIKKPYRPYRPARSRTLKGSETDADSIKAGKDYSTALPSLSTIKLYMQLYTGLFF